MLDKTIRYSAERLIYLHIYPQIDAFDYNYQGLGPNAVSSVSLVGGGSVSFGYDGNGNMTSGHGKTMTYNAFNKPLTITVGGTVVDAFSYGADLMRYRHGKAGGGVTLYLDKYMEIDTVGGTTSYRHYLGDVAILTKTGTLNDPNPEIEFVHRDRLGSAAVLTDESGGNVRGRGFDPFGKPRNENWSDRTPPTLGRSETERGFTDHEHLDDAQLIHMNGRAFDYNLGRFLSVDPIIQAPGNSQGLNPYSYIMNNPLAGTDPSGYNCRGTKIDSDDGSICGGVRSWYLDDKTMDYVGPASSGGIYENYHNGTSHGQGSSAQFGSPDNTGIGGIGERDGGGDFTRPNSVAFGKDEVADWSESQATALDALLIKAKHTSESEAAMLRRSRISENVSEALVAAYGGDDEQVRGDLASSLDLIAKIATGLRASDIRKVTEDLSKERRTTSVPYLVAYDGVIYVSKSFMQDLEAGRVIGFPLLHEIAHLAGMGHGAYDLDIKSGRADGWDLARRSGIWAKSDLNERYQALGNPYNLGLYLLERGKQ